MSDSVQDHNALQAFAKFLTEVYEQGWQEGYAAAEDEWEARFDSALADAQHAGRNVGRQEFIQEVVSTLDRDARLSLISDLENAIHKERFND